MGLGQSKESFGFGGTSAHPFMGIGQGAGSSPGGFSTISTLMISAYKSKGHGCQLHAIWTTLALMLAAILFVDDSDLLHRGRSASVSDNEFFDQIQHAVMTWGGLVQAT